MGDMLETQLGRRIVAAAALRGWHRTDIPGYAALYGRNFKTIPGKLARDPDAEPDDLQLQGLSRVFGLPEAWFTEPDLERLVDGATEPISDVGPEALEEAAGGLGGESEPPEETGGATGSPGGGG